MNDKIAWFEELLTLEPNSKLFFPLAQAYARKDRLQDAAKVLRQGLSFHPEHLEARLLLIQCLARLDQDKAAQEQTQHLADTLSGYPEFWNSWAERSKETVSQDVALMLRLLAKHLKGEAVHWSEILEQGMKAVIMADGSGRSSSRDKDSTGTTGSLNAPKTLEPPVSTAQGTASEQPLASVFDAESASHPSAEAVRQMSATERNYYETRTYADLLAEQGEDKEALELYDKLLRLSRDGRQREELEERIVSLKERGLRSQPGADFQSDAPVQDTDQPPMRQASAKAEPQKASRTPELVTTLTRLAERLEARSQA